MPLRADIYKTHFIDYLFVNEKIYQLVVTGTKLFIIFCITAKREALYIEHTVLSS